MPRLWIFSDLHQDHAGNAWDPGAHAPRDGFDIAVVAGDLHSPLTKAIDWLGDRLAGARAIYVPGNHDFWFDQGDDKYTHDDMIGRGRDIAARRGIDLLIDDVALIDGVRFLGATLWTDMRLATFSMSYATATVRGGMNDYKRIRRKPTGRHKHLRPINSVALHRVSRAFIDDALTTPFAGPSVVVTHHAWHPECLWDRNADLCWCYASNLGDLIHARAPDLWIHGHVHDRVDHRVGTTRIICNARGHVEEPSAKALDNSLVVDIAPTDGASR